MPVNTKNQSILFAWIGLTDLKVARREIVSGLGPIGQAVKMGGFSEVHCSPIMISKADAMYSKWL